MIKRPPDLDKARGYVTHGVELYPGNFAMHGTLADIELIAGHRDQAIAVLQQGLKATDRHPDLLWKLVNLLIDGKDLKGARQIVEELRAKDHLRRFSKTQDRVDYSVLIDYLAARIELAQGHWLAARQGFEKICDALVVAAETGETGLSVDCDVLRQVRRSRQATAGLAPGAAHGPLVRPREGSLTQAAVAHGQD